MYGRGRFNSPQGNFGGGRGGFRGGYGGGGGGYGGPRFGGPQHGGGGGPTPLMSRPVNHGAFNNRPLNFRPRGTAVAYESRPSQPDIPPTNSDSTAMVKSENKPSADIKAKEELMTSPNAGKMSDTDSRKRGIEEVDSKGSEDSLAKKPMVAEVDSDAPDVKNPESTILDFYNSDLNLAIEKDGLTASSINQPNGFCFVWAGARANHGVTSGKICFEVKVLDLINTDFGPDHKEKDPHVLRIGWSTDGTSFQLGEEPFSYGYGGTGKFSFDCKFSNYGERFTKGDIITCLVDFQERVPNISFSKNGRWFGVAKRLTEIERGNKKHALFPHILSKNIKFTVNFGAQQPTWKPTPPGFTWIDLVPFKDKVLGMTSPLRKQDCEMLMMVGLPGVGKTTWAEKKAKAEPEKRFNIIGTDSLIDKMKVQGLPRKRNFTGRWDNLIKMASECLNKMFIIGGKRRRNYILDQTNVYPNARRKKMNHFENFKRKCIVVVPSDAEMKRRSDKRTKEDGKEVPESAVLQMKANFTLPSESDPHVDSVEWVELSRQQAIPIIDNYNREGKASDSNPPAPKGMGQSSYGRGQDRGQDRSQDRGHDRSQDRGHDRSQDRGQDRGHDRDRGRDRSRDRDRNQDRGGQDRRGGGGRWDTQDRQSDRGGRGGQSSSRGDSDRPWQRDQRGDQRDGRGADPVKGGPGSHSSGSSSWPPNDGQQPSGGPSRWDKQEDTKPAAPWANEPAGGGRPPFGGSDAAGGSRGPPYGRGAGLPDRGSDQWSAMGAPERGPPKPWERSEGSDYPAPGGARGGRIGGPPGRGGGGGPGYGRGYGEPEPEIKEDPYQDQWQRDQPPASRDPWSERGAGEPYGRGAGGAGYGDEGMRGGRGGFRGGPGGRGGYGRGAPPVEDQWGRDDGYGGAHREREPYGGREGELPPGGRGRGAAPPWGRRPEDKGPERGGPPGWGSEAEHGRDVGGYPPRGAARGGRGGGGSRGEEGRDDYGYPDYSRPPPGGSRDPWGGEGDKWAEREPWAEPSRREPPASSWGEPPAGRGRGGGPGSQPGWREPEKPAWDKRPGGYGGDDPYSRPPPGGRGADPYGHPPPSRGGMDPHGQDVKSDPWSRPPPRSDYPYGTEAEREPPVAKEPWKRPPPDDYYNHPPPTGREPPVKGPEGWKAGPEKPYGQSRYEPPGQFGMEADPYSAGKPAEVPRVPEKKPSRWGDPLPDTQPQQPVEKQPLRTNEPPAWRAEGSGFGGSDYDRGYGGSQPGSGARGGYQGYDQQQPPAAAASTTAATPAVATEAKVEHQMGTQAAKEEEKEEDYSQYEAQGWRWEVTEDGSSGQWVWRPDLVKSTDSSTADPKAQAAPASATGTAAAYSGVGGNAATQPAGYGGYGGTAPAATGGSGGYGSAGHWNQPAPADAAKTGGAAATSGGYGYGQDYGGQQGAAQQPYGQQGGYGAAKPPYGGGGGARY